MSQDQQSGVTPQPAPVGAPEHAYQQGFLAGHRAGWYDALAALAESVPLPPNVMPQRPPFGGSTASSDRRVVTSRGPAPSPAPAAPPTVAASKPLGAPLPANPQSASPTPAHPTAPADPLVTAANKRRRETQNINIVLYVASLLMVAAAALFVGSSLPGTARLVGVWLVTALFYSAGLILHGKAVRLRPAAIAFTGTALAIIPFAGIATYNLGFQEASIVWLMTSLIGAASYVYAAVRLRSRLVVYVSVAFLLSTAWSSVAVIGAALAWYFTALIVFAAALGLVGHLLQSRTPVAGSPGNLYAKALTELGPWFAPVGLIGSLSLGLRLNAADHSMVLLAGAFYYAITTLTSEKRYRRYNYAGFRLSLTVAAPFLGWLVRPEFEWAAAAFSTVLAAQLLVMTYAQRPLSTHIAHASWVRRDVYLSVPVLAIGSLLWSVAESMGNADTADTGAWGTSLGVGVGLVTTMGLVPAFRPRGQWLLVPAAGAVLLCAPFLEATDWTAILGVSLGYALISYFAAATVPLKRAMLVISRFLVTALVAAWLDVALPASPGRTELIVTVIAVIVAVQLLSDALLLKFGTANPLRNYSAVFWAVTGTALVMFLSAEQWGAQSPETQLHATSGTLPSQFIVASVTMGFASAAYSLPWPRRAGSRRPELLAPLYFIVAALCTGPVLHADGASIAWTVTSAYLLVAGTVLGKHSAPLHRWSYWWAARMVSLLLTVALFQLWQEFDPTTRLSGTPVELGHVLLLALLPQVLILAWVLVRGSAVPGLSIDFYLTIFAVLTLAAGVVAGSEGGRWTTMAAVGLAVAAVAGLNMVGATQSRALQAARWTPPTALIAIALACMGHRPLLLLVLGVAVVAWAYTAANAQLRLSRSGYFLLARIVATVFLAQVVRQLSADETVLTIAVTAALVLQVLLQYLAIRVGQLNAAVGDWRVLQPSLWLLLAVQLVLPLSYYLAAGGFTPVGSANRWVVVLELAVLAGTGVAAQAWLRQRGASYLAIIAIMGASGVIEPLLVPGATAAVLMAGCVAVIIWRCVHTPRTLEMRGYWLVTTVSFLLTALLVDDDAPLGVIALMWAVVGLCLISAGHLLKQDWVVLPAAVLLFLAAFLFREQVLEVSGRPGYSALAGYVAVVGALYVVRLLLLDALEARPVERYSVLGTALAGGVFFALWSMFDDETVLLGASAYTLVAILACLEVPAPRRRLSLDAAIVSGAAVWFWACERYVQLGMYWAVQWCAVALGLLAVVRYLSSRQRTGRTLLIYAAAFTSLAAVTTIFSDETAQQIVSLVIFVALLAAGMSLAERVFTIWGAIGVTTAVLWYLRGFTYILLALLALALIAFAIWRLNSKKPDGDAQAGTRQVTPTVTAPVTRQETPSARQEQPMLHQSPHPGSDFPHS